MKKNNKGFIAISLIYSFFLVFLVTLLGITIEYAENRILLNKVKKATQDYLNTLSEFNPVKLANKAYTSGEEVIYAGETWIVLEDSGESIKLILKNSLSNEIIKKAFNAKSISIDGFVIPGGDGLDNNIQGPVDGDNVTMCLNTYNNRYCSYDVVDKYRKLDYSWEKSIVKMVADYWFENSSVLQKAKDTGGLLVQQFTDGIKEYNEFIRISTVIELRDIYNSNSVYPSLTATEMWNLTHANTNDAGSYISVQFGSAIGWLAHTNYKKINPILVVNKSQ